MAESAQTYLTETEHYMLPDSIQNQPNKKDMCASGDFRRAAEPVKLSQARNMPSSASLERSDAFHSACDSTAAEDIEETFCTRLVSAEKQTQHSLNLELLQETSVEASLSLDIELEMHQRNARSMQAGDCWDKGKADFEARGFREAETYSSVPGYQELEKETLPDYYSFNSTGFYEAERDASSGLPCMSSDTESGATADPLGDTPEEGCYKTSEKCSNAALEESKGCDSQCTSSLDDWPDGTSFSEYGYGSEGDPENDQNFEVYHSIAEGTSFTAEQDELQTESTRPAGLRCDHCLPVPDGTKSSADKDANNNDNNSLLEVDSSIDCLGWDVPEKPCGFKCEPPVARDDTSLYEESFLSAAAANSLLPEPSIEMDISGYVGASAFEHSGQYRESDAEESPATTCQRCLAASGSTIRVNQIIDASADFRAGFTSTTATEASVFVASKSTSTDNPGVPHAHAAVNTEWSLLQGMKKDHDFTEDWFDAEENLRTDGQIDDVLDNTGVTRQTAGGICGRLKCENSAEREKQPDHYLCVRDLSVTVTEVFKRNYEKLQCVQDTPTASGTFLTQHYAGLSSFDKLMDRLMKLHPEAGRQKIVEALIELRAEKKGFLSGLPLKTIVEMTSAVLKKNLTG
ncbi:RNA-binding protein 44 [Acipenser ruthenus]|uniref:RNA-binding protein 44 n=1 Tax=Acipenser ruthenus TaxID=7906 RepID=A0A662YRL5_ACIRT|nr:RNA-binding protein 44 [Acipenser ruthenus]